MTASQGLLTWLIGIATLITALSPVVLLVLIVRDWKGKKLW